MKPRFYNAHETRRMDELNGMELASFRSRAFALALDFIIASLIFIPIALAAVFIGKWLGKDLYIKLDFFGNWYSIIWLVVYFGLTVYIGDGRTPAKRWLGIRVVSLVHERMGFWHSIERALGYGASTLEFGFGFVQYFIDPNCRTVHDRIAETIVVREKKPTHPDSAPNR